MVEAKQSTHPLTRGLGLIQETPWSNEEMMCLRKKFGWQQMTSPYILLGLGLMKTVIFELGVTLCKLVVHIVLERR